LIKLKIFSTTPNTKKYGIDFLKNILRQAKRSINHSVVATGEAIVSPEVGHVVLYNDLVILCLHALAYEVYIFINLINLFQNSIFCDILFSSYLTELIFHFWYQSVTKN